MNNVLADLNKRHGAATQSGDLDAIREISDQYETLLNSAPNEVALLFGVGTCKLQLGLNGAAINYLQRAAHVRPDTPEIWNNLGSAWKAEHNNEEAERCFRTALDLREDADYYNNIATLHINEGRPEQGLAAAQRAIDLNPDHDKAHWNHGLLLLELGQWPEGFVEYDAGLRSGDRPVRHYASDPRAVPFWDGRPGKRLVVYGEQGIGDEVLFASAIPDLIRESREVVFDCHPRMEALMRRSFGVACYGTRKKNEITWPREHQLDAKVAIGSLFRYFRRHGDFPRQPYLKPDPERVAAYRERLEALGPGPYVGLAWRGGAKKTRMDLRSVKLRRFIPILDQGGTFVSMQYTDDAAGKVERFQAERGYTIHHWPEAVEAENYDETVALAAALDLVICVNTSLVHVCGAIGQHCWTLTPSAPAWRYQLEGEDMPFYGPWVRQYREGDSWDAMFQQVARDYAAFKAEREVA